MFPNSDDLPDLSQYSTKPKKDDKTAVAETVDDELSKLGWSENARLSMLGDLGRENGWDRNIIFKGHSDPKNNADNVGIISWQGSRRTKLLDYLEKEGRVKNGSIDSSDDSLRSMVRFMDAEMRDSTEWKNIHDQMRRGDITTAEASKQLQKYIKYVPTAPYNTPDDDFNTKNNRKYAERAKSLGLGKLPDLSQFASGGQSGVAGDTIAQAENPDQHIAPVEVDTLDELTKQKALLDNDLKRAPKMRDKKQIKKSLDLLQKTIDEETLKRAGSSSARPTVETSQPVDSANPAGGETLPEKPRRWDTLLPPEFSAPETLTLKDGTEIALDQDRTGLENNEFRYVTKDGKKIKMTVGQPDEQGSYSPSFAYDGEPPQSAAADSPLYLTDNSGRSFAQTGDQSGLARGDVRVRMTGNDKGGIAIARAVVGKDGKTSYQLFNEGETPEPAQNPDSRAQKSQPDAQRPNNANNFSGETPAQVKSREARELAESLKLADQTARDQNNQAMAQDRAATDTPTQAITSEQAKTPQGILKTVPVDIRQKPQGEQTGKFLLRSALEQVAPDFNITSAEIENYLDTVAASGKAFAAVNNDATDEQIAGALAEGQQPVVNFSVTENAVNAILRQKNGFRTDGEITPEVAQNRLMKEAQSPQGMDERGDIRSRDEAEKRAEELTRQQIADPDFLGKIKALAPYAIKGAAGFAASESGVPDKDSFFTVDKQMDDIRNEYGTFDEYQKNKQYADQMFVGEYVPRLVLDVGRATLKTSISDSIKGAEFLSDIAEKFDPVNLALNALGLEKFSPNVRNLGNMLAYSVAYLQNPKKADYLRDALGKDSDIDRRSFYQISKALDKALGDDPTIKNTFLGQFTQPVGSSLGFILLGMAAPELSLGTALGEFSLTSAGSGALTAFGSGYEEGKQNGLSETKSKAYGIVQGFLGMTEGFGIGASVNRAIKDEALRRTFLKSFSAFVKESGETVFKGGAEEAIQEFVQTTGGKIALEALKDKEPSAYEKIKNLFAGLPEQAISTLTKEVPIAFATGGVMEGATHIGAHVFGAGHGAGEHEDSFEPDDLKNENLPRDTSVKPIDTPVVQGKNTDSETAKKSKNDEISQKSDIKKNEQADKPNEQAAKQKPVKDSKTNVQENEQAVKNVDKPKDLAVGTQVKFTEPQRRRANRRSRQNQRRKSKC